MNCTRLEAWLADQPDANRAELPPEWMQHVATCPACAQCWQDERRLAAAIVAWRTTPPCPPATDALIATLLQQVAARPAATTTVRSVTPWSGTWPILVATAALVLLGIGFTQFLPPSTQTVAVPAGESVALTSTVGSLLQQFEQAPQEMFAAGRSGLPAIPSLPTNSSRGAHFDSVELIDPTAPSAVLRYGEPLGHGVGQAFQFLQIAVPIPTSDAS